MSAEKSNKGHLIGFSIGVFLVGALHAFGKISIDGTYDSMIYYGGYGGCGGMIAYELFRKLFGGGKSSSK